MKHEYAAIPISADSYKSFGDLLSIRPEIASRPTNQGTAKRYDHVAKFQNLRPGIQEPNIAFFRCSPVRVSPHEAKLLERHPKSTQIFFPTSVDISYLVIVAHGKEKPDLSSLQAFLVRGGSGISYFPGIWHHPLIALGKESDFLCLVWEDKGPEDCELVQLEDDVSISFAL